MKAADIVRIVGEEFDDVQIDKIDFYVDLVRPLVSKKQFGKLYEHAVALLAAHNLKMSGYGDSSTGTVADSLRVSSYSEGSTSISFSVSQGNNLQPNAEYTLTTYGLQYLSLRRTVIVPIRVSGGR